MYQLYKPLRNCAREFGLVPALGHIWHFAAHLAYGNPLPFATPRDRDGVPIVFRNLVFPWDLEILAREMVLNGGETGGRSLGEWSDMGQIINLIHDVENRTFERYGSSRSVLLELHRIAHRQFPWQRRPNMGSFLRNWKIWSYPVLAELVELNVGLTVRQHTELCLAVAGNFTNKIGMVTTSDYGLLGISREASAAFFDRLSSSTNDLRARMQAEQLYDGDWVYSYNPLRDRPLVRFDANHPERVMCPLPALLLNRMSDGLYYDLCMTKGFNSAFGPAFQAYVGEVLAVTLNLPGFNVSGEQEYHVGNNRKDGVDWVAGDSTATIFIECKTKRLRQSAKFSSVSDELDDELRTLARFIVQTYKNIADAKAGHTAWKPNDAPVYPIVVTLENWYLFTPDVAEPVDEYVRSGLTAAGLSPSLADEMPYAVLSMEEFELAAEIMSRIGIQRYMAAKTEPEHRTWAASGIPASLQGEVPRSKTYLFEAEWTAFQTDLEGRHAAWKRKAKEGHE